MYPIRRTYLTGWLIRLSLRRPSARGAVCQICAQFIQYTSDTYFISHSSSVVVYLQCVGCITWDRVRQLSFPFSKGRTLLILHISRSWEFNSAEYYFTRGVPGIPRNKLGWYVVPLYGIIIVVLLFLAPTIVIVWNKDLERCYSMVWPCAAYGSFGAVWFRTLSHTPFMRSHPYRLTRVNTLEFHC